MPEQSPKVIEQQLSKVTPGTEMYKGMKLLHDAQQLAGERSPMRNLANRVVVDIVGGSIGLATSLVTGKTLAEHPDFYEWWTNGQSLFAKYVITPISHQVPAGGSALVQGLAFLFTAAGANALGFLKPYLVAIGGYAIAREFGVSDAASITSGLSAGAADLFVASRNFPYL